MGIVDEAAEAVRGKGKDQASASQGKCECDRGKNSRRGKGEGRYERLGGQGTLGKVHSTSTSIASTSILRIFTPGLRASHHSLEEREGSTNRRPVQVGASVPGSEYLRIDL